MSLRARAKPEPVKSAVKKAPAKKATAPRQAAKRRATEETDADDDGGKSFKAPKAVAPGWGGAKQTQDENSSYATNFKFESEPQIVYFVDDAPFSSYAQHWLEREGKRGFACIKKWDTRGCPLDDIGDKPRVLALFNVAVLDPENDPVLQVIKAGPRLKTLIESAKDERDTWPLSKVYWAMSASGKGSKYTHKMRPVKARDLLEDWGLEPLTAEVIADLTEKKYGFDAVETLPTHKQLMELAEEYAGD